MYFINFIGLLFLIIENSIAQEEDSLLQIVLRPLFGNQPFFLQQESIIGQNIATQSSPTFANQLLTADDASQGTNAANSTKVRRRKTRRRENRFGRRGKLINSINHGKTSLTRYRKGELFSGPHETFSTFPIPNDQISLIQTGITSNILQDDLTIGQNLTISPNQTQVQLSNLSVDSNLTTAQATAQFSNQILGPSNSSTTTSPSLAPTIISPQLSQNQILEEVSEEKGKGSIGFHSYRHLGGIGECRHNFHCIGSEACVNFKGNFICTRRFCNTDRDCRGSKMCRDNKCVKKSI